MGRQRIRAVLRGCSQFSATAGDLWNQAAATRQLDPEQRRLWAELAEDFEGNPGELETVCRALTAEAVP